MHRSCVDHVAKRHSVERRRSGWIRRRMRRADPHLLAAVDLAADPGRNRRAREDELVLVIAGRHQSQRRVRVRHGRRARRQTIVAGV